MDGTAVIKTRSLIFLSVYDRVPFLEVILCTYPIHFYSNIYLHTRQRTYNDISVNTPKTLFSNEVTKTRYCSYCKLLIALSQQTKKQTQLTSNDLSLLSTSVTREVCSINGYVFRCLQSFQEIEVDFNRFKKSRLWIVIGRFQSMLSLLFFFFHQILS